MADTLILTGCFWLFLCQILFKCCVKYPLDQNGTNSYNFQRHCWCSFVFFSIFSTLKEILYRDRLIQTPSQAIPYNWQGLLYHLAYCVLTEMTSYLCQNTLDKEGCKQIHSFCSLIITFFARQLRCNVVFFMRNQIVCFFSFVWPLLRVCLSIRTWLVLLVHS